MFILADLPIDPNVIIVFAMMIFAGIKALIDKAQGQKNGDAEPPALGEEDFDPYEQYEAELDRQRAEMNIPLPSEQTAPPPLPLEPISKQVMPAKPARPSLSDAEKMALQNLKLISPSKSKRTHSTKLRVKKHLASPTAAREALLLAEILGPPKALKTEEGI